ncbi:hypothetical protein [Bradyrhizobium sp. 6(2017)]|nr:hypothetical protein G6P99_00300 [Bradyrhizobium sp. 6(2017)]
MPHTDRLLFAAGLACVGYVVITLVMVLTVTFRRTGSMGTASQSGPP